jgi:16S rRNA (cytidine1402-2'-O)-methyltransferase
MNEPPSFGKLYLIPSLLAETEPLEVLPLAVKKVIDMVDHFIVENEKTARHFIKKVLPSKDQPSLSIELLNKFTDASELERLLTPCKQGKHMGVLSEAGCPGIADPGSDLIALAHSIGIRVVPLVGPSSILLAMMASGMNGQNFAFVGYLPIDRQEKKAKIKQLEKLSRTTGQSQIFIETPYRNDKLVDDLLSILSSQTRLCIATNITANDESIKTYSVDAWKKRKSEIGKVPSLFIIDAR